jgi:hypothetical protein
VKDKEVKRTNYWRDRERELMRENDDMGTKIRTF